MAFRSKIITTLVLLTLGLTGTRAQSGQTLFGDIRVDESKVEGLKPTTFEIILYTEGGAVLGRQTVSNNGRYRFNNLNPGMFVLGIECEGREITRLRIDMLSPLLGDLRQDIEFEWKATGGTGSKPAAISAADQYARSRVTQDLFDKAQQEADKKHYDRAVDLLRRIVESDPKDFLTWTELANVHLLIKDFSHAESEYLHAIDLHANFFLALLNLGRLEVAQQKYDVAIDVLSRAVQVRPQSPDANYFLGEAYLQLKQGSLAVVYLNEALKLDPQGMAEVHLRLAALYHAAGLKDKAAIEYEEFLKKKPDYPDKKKIEQYIIANKRH